MITCPNDGGLLIIVDGELYIIDHQNTTGFIHGHKSLGRAIPYKQNRAKLELSADGKTISIDLEGDDADPHDLFMIDNRIVCANTGSNQLIFYGPDGIELERRSYPGERDAWHINCISRWSDSTAVSCFGRFNTHRGYKDNTVKAGFIFDIESNRILWDGLSQPHSPLYLAKGQFVCDSETHRLLKRDSQGREQSVQFDGYTRGLASGMQHLYVGVSASRTDSGSETKRGSAKVVALDLDSLQPTGEIAIPFREIYGIHVLPNDTNTLLMLFRLALAERDTMLNELILPRLHMQKLHECNQTLHRLQRHPLIGLLLRLMARIKRDPSFGGWNSMTK